MYRIALLVVVAMMFPADVFGQCGGGFFSGGRVSRGGCGSGWTSGSYCGSYCGSYGSCGVVSSDNGCGSCQSDASDTSSPVKAKIDKGVPAPKPAAPKPAAPKHPTEMIVSFQTTTGSGRIILENVSPSARVIINEHLTSQTGMRRVYKSVNLSQGSLYRYHIVVQYGHGIQEVWQVALTSGDTKVVKVN